MTLLEFEPKTYKLFHNGCLLYLLLLVACYLAYNHDHKPVVETIIHTITRYLTTDVQPSLYAFHNRHYMCFPYYWVLMQLGTQFHMECISSIRVYIISTSYLRFGNHAFLIGKIHSCPISLTRGPVWFLNFKRLIKSINCTYLIMLVISSILLVNVN